MTKKAEQVFRRWHDQLEEGGAGIPPVAWPIRRSRYSDAVCDDHGGEMPTQYAMIMEARCRRRLRSSWKRSRLPRSRGYPAEFMEAKPSPTYWQSRLSCGVHGGEAVSHAIEVILRSSWRRHGSDVQNGERPGWPHRTGTWRGLPRTCRRSDDSSRNVC